MRRGDAFRKRPVVSDNTASCSAARTPPSELAPCDSTDGFDDPELLALGHAILFKQCELGFGYPVAVSEVPEQAVITGHNRAEFLKMAMLLLGRGAAHSRIRQGRIPAAIEGFPGAPRSNHDTFKRGFEHKSPSILPGSVIKSTR